MAKYRKKPVVIEAIQLTEHNLFDVMSFMGNRPDLSHPISNDKFDDYKKIMAHEGLAIKTLEGIMRASINDYVIKGIKGEFYPCKPDIFESTYEAVGE